jgi:hypothetical protein
MSLSALLGGASATARSERVTELAFLSERGSSLSIVLAGRGAVETVGRDAFSTTAPVWTRDGRRVAYTTRTRLVLKTIGGSSRSFDGCRGRVALAPDARAALCEASGEADGFNHIDLVTGAVTLLGSNDDGLGDTTPQDPAWAANGLIALRPSAEAQLWLYRLADTRTGPRLQRLRALDSPLRDEPRDGLGPEPLFPMTDPEFSPDSRWIAFAAGQELWISDVRTGRIARRTNVRGEEPSWSPGGQHIAFARSVNGKNKEIFVIPVSGGKATRMTFSAGADTDPAWRPLHR